MTIDTWKNKPLRLTRFFNEPKPGKFSGRFGEFYFLTKDVEQYPSHEAGELKFQREQQFKNPLVIDDELDALKIFYPTTAQEIIDASINSFDVYSFGESPLNQYYINYFQYVDNLLANKAKQAGYDAIIYKKRDSWGATQTEIQDLTHYKIKPLKISVEELLRKANG
jgi:hypothetical protein